VTASASAPGFDMSWSSATAGKPRPPVGTRAGRIEHGFEDRAGLPPRRLDVWRQRAGPVLSAQPRNIIRPRGESGDDRGAAAVRRRDMTMEEIDDRQRRAIGRRLVLARHAQPFHRWTLDLAGAKRRRILGRGEAAPNLGPGRGHDSITRALRRDGTATSTPRRRASTLRDIAAPRDQGFVSQFK
jgi:hypothetical protein